MRKLTRKIKDDTEWFYGKHRSDKDIGIKPTPKDYDGELHNGLPIIHSFNCKIDFPNLEPGNAIYYRNIDAREDGYGSSGVIRKMIITDIISSTLQIKVDSAKQTARIVKRVILGMTSLTKDNKLGNWIEGKNSGNKPSCTIVENFDLSKDDYGVGFAKAVKNTHIKHKAGVVYMDSRDLRYQSLEDNCREDIYKNRGKKYEEL